MKKFTRYLIAFSTLLAVVRCAPSHKPLKADLILINGQIFTADPKQPSATAVAISGDSILVVGSDETVKKYQTAETQVIDLQGAFAMPGFIEGHGHFLGLGGSLVNLNLLHTKSWN